MCNNYNLVHRNNSRSFQFPANVLVRDVTTSLGISKDSNALNNNKRGRSLITWTISLFTKLLSKLLLYLLFKFGYALLGLINGIEVPNFIENTKLNLGEFTLLDVLKANELNFDLEIAQVNTGATEF